MTLPASGPLQLGTQSGGSSINSEFGYGNDLASYLGVYYGRGGLVYRFPVPGNQISMGGSASPGDSGFYSAQKITGGSASYGSSTTITVPLYNTITITAQGGQGGQAGQFGFYQSPCSPAGSATPSSGGGGGGTSSYGGYVTGGGGPGGGGNAGSGSYAPAGVQSFTNPVQGGSGPPSGTSISVTVGGGGSGGGGGCVVYELVFNKGTRDEVNYGCQCWAQAGTGSPGGAGYVSVLWT